MGRAVEAFLDAAAERFQAYVERLSVANETASLPIAYQLHLPEVWVSDRRRRRRASVLSANPAKPTVALI